MRKIVLVLNQGETSRVNIQGWIKMTSLFIIWLLDFIFWLLTTFKSTVSSQSTPHLSKLMRKSLLICLALVESLYYILVPSSQPHPLPLIPTNLEKRALNILTMYYFYICCMPLIIQIYTVLYHKFSVLALPGNADPHVMKYVLSSY